MFFVIYSHGKKMLMIDTMYIIGPVGLIIYIIWYKRFMRREKARQLAEVALLEQQGKALNIRGGQQEPQTMAEWMILDMTSPNFICWVGKGVRYIEDKGVRKLVTTLFKNKAKNNVIFITKSALCQLIAIHGISLPLPMDSVYIPKAFGITNWVDPARNVLAAATFITGLCFGTVALKSKAPLQALEAIRHAKQKRLKIALAAASFVASGFMLIWRRDPGVFVITNTFIALDGKIIALLDSSRVPNLVDVVSSDLKDTNAELINGPLSNVCKIPGVEKIKKCSKFPDYNPDLGLSYDQLVNMEDVLGTKNVDPNVKFNDIFDLGHPNLKNSVPKSEPLVKEASSKILKIKGKMVNFLDKFGDPDIIPADSQWEIDDSMKKLIEKKIKDN